MSNGHEAKNINTLYPRPKGRGSTAIFDRKAGFHIRLSDIKLIATSLNG